jgi:hypothetical protein
VLGRHGRAERLGAGVEITGRRSEVRYERPPAGFEASIDVDLDLDAASVRLVRQELALLDADDLDAAAGSDVGRRLLCAVAARMHDGIRVPGAGPSTQPSEASGCRATSREGARTQRTGTGSHDGCHSRLISP